MAVEEVTDVDVGIDFVLNKTKRHWRKRSSFISMTPHGVIFDELVTVAIPYDAENLGELELQVS